MSCKIISIDEFDNIIPDRPPIVNNEINPIDHKIDGVNLIFVL